MTIFFIFHKFDHNFPETGLISVKLCQKSRLSLLTGDVNEPVWKLVPLETGSLSAKNAVCHYEQIPTMYSLYNSE